ncbi:MAG TPA: hypothetical protein VGQ08_07755 [Nitrospiraceae bacterium]|nr:hypothetical protein [Nitrospiraceae bacterium]
MNFARPLVVGYPRTGFTLLISVIAEITRYAHHSSPIAGCHALKAFCDTAGLQIAARIEQVFQRRGLSADLCYNYNFKQMVGGPKWLKEGDDRVACFRKYIGIRGKGDFTLFTTHPREVLEYYEIIHSHMHPVRWVSHPSYQDVRRFASIRHPADTITSACFSLNALASEYIQRFVPPEDDTDLIRQRLALYKLSDLNFFEALISPFKAYLEEFDTCADRYFVMRWEDLIQEPVKTIQAIAHAMRIPVQPDQAAEIWRRLDHVNLTGAHKHNLRRGHGVVGGWRKWLTNTHLGMLRDYGLEAYSERFGYGRIDTLDEGAYTPFQKSLAAYIERGEVFREYGDEDLFRFAFNKSNLDLNRFAFKRYEWRKHTRIERSSCTDDDLVMEVWNVAEEACAMVNRALDRWFHDGRENGPNDKRVVDDIISELTSVFVDSRALSCCRSAMLEAIESEEKQAEEVRHGIDAKPSADPVLLKSIGTTNIVSFGGKYYAVPQSLGPIDFYKESVVGHPGVQVADSLSNILSLVGEV